LLSATADIARSQGPDRSSAKGERSASSDVTERWTYRSFRSDPDLNTEPNDLLFGSGTLELTQLLPGGLSGTLGGEGWSLALTGEVKDGAPVSISFRGKGIIAGEEWVYDYVGYVVPAWPNGIDQRPAIVGTIIRVVPHSAGQAPSGYVAQWVAVKQDASPEGHTIAPVERSGADRELSDLEIAWVKAVESNDPDRISIFLSQMFLFVGAGGVLQNRKEHLNDFGSGQLDVESVIVSDVTARIYEGYAVTNTLAAVKGKFGNRDISGSYRFMDTWQKEGGRWIAVARQQTRVANTPVGLNGGPATATRGHW
jgi:hypothetical protein